MHSSMPAEIINLINLVKTKSKHSDYQLLHPLINKVVGDIYKPSGKKEEERQAYMESLLSLKNKTVLDIGANIGYFSFGAIEAGAAKVICIEGNTEHAEFIAAASKCTNLSNQFEVHCEYFDFNNSNLDRFDIILCLNVLHHLGCDFGNERIAMEDAKEAMLQSLNALANKCDAMWVQLGFNWKGDRFKPLFPMGTKSELIDFIQSGILKYWKISDIAVYDPNISCYASVNSSNINRFNEIGEFLNRPLFLLESKCV